MTITRETLELAAKAAGYEVTFNATGEAWIAAPSEVEAGRRNLVAWQPDDDDGDSARLRTDLEIDIVFWPSLIIVRHEQYMLKATRADHVNKHAALRYATLMVAAEIGRRMK